MQPSTKEFSQDIIEGSRLSAEEIVPPFLGIERRFDLVVSLEIADTFLASAQEWWARRLPTSCTGGKSS